MLFFLLSYLTLVNATPATPPAGGFACYGYQQTELDHWDTQSCLTQTQINSIGYYPFDGKGTKLQYEFMTWPSQWISTFVHAILAKEVMGYSVGYTCVDGGDNGNARIELGYSDLAMEFWYENYEGQAVEYMQNRLTVVDAGYLGYQGRSGIYTPNYMQTQIAALSGVSDADFLANVFNFWKVYTSPAVVGLYLNQNDTDMAAGVTQNSVIFTPPWCNAWTLDGTNQNCVDLKAESPSYDTGHVQQFIMNHRLNWTISWWGYGGVQTYVNRMMTAQRPVLFKYWVPTMFLANRPVSRLTLPESSQACLRNNTKSLNGIGSIDCDFTRTSLRKIVATRVFNSDQDSAYRGFSMMTRRLQITTEQMDNLLSDLRGTTHNYSYYAACQFLRDNIPTWKNWIIERTCTDGATLQGDGSCYKKPEEDHSIYFYAVLGLLPVLALVFYFILKSDKGDEVAEMLMAMLSETTMIALSILLHTLDFSTDLSSFIVIAGHPDLQEFVIPYALFLSIGGCSSFTNIFFGLKALHQILCNRGQNKSEPEGISMESKGNLGSPTDSKRNFSEKAVITDGGKMLNIKSQAALDYYKTRADQQIRMCLVTILVCIFEDIPLLVINGMVLHKLGKVDVVVLVSLLFNTLICGTVAATWKDLMASITAQKTLKEHMGNLSGRDSGTKGLKSSKLLKDSTGVVQVKSSPPMSPNSTKVVPLRSENAF